MFDYEITAERVLKLCCLFELHGLSDCASELLLTPILSSLEDREALLDAVVPDALFGQISCEFMQRFDVNSHSFFPSLSPRAARFPDDDPPGIQELVQAPDQRDALSEKNQQRESDLQRRKAEHRQRIIELTAQKDRLRAYKLNLKDQKTRIRNYKQRVAALQKRVGK